VRERERESRRESTQREWEGEELGVKVSAVKVKGERGERESQSAALFRERGERERESRQIRIERGGRARSRDARAVKVERKEEREGR